MDPTPKYFGHGSSITASNSRERLNRKYEQCIVLFLTLYYNSKTKAAIKIKQTMLIKKPNKCGSRTPIYLAFLSICSFNWTAATNTRHLLPGLHELEHVSTYPEL